MFEFFQDFHFIRPYWLLALPVLMALCWYAWRHSTAQSNWKGVCDPHLLNHLLSGHHERRGHAPFYLMLAAAILACIGISGPSWERLPQPVFQGLDSRVIVFDLSESMNSQDLKPSRLQRGKYKLMDIIESGRGKQQALVVFAGDAFVVTPLTDDTETLLNLVPSLHTDTVPIQGSNASAGLTTAIELLNNAGGQSGEIILVTDGVDEASFDTADQLANGGFRLIVLAVGTEQGAPIPLSNGELMKDAQGNIVIPGISIERLDRLAKTGNGYWLAITADDQDVRQINTAMETLPQNLGFNSDSGSFQSDKWIDNGPWFLLPLLLIASLAFRKGWLLASLVFIQPLVTPPAIAFEWQDLWKRPDQQAASAYKAQAFDKLEQSELPEWQATAAYRSEKYQQAAEIYSKLDDPENLYNKGNALAKSGQLSQAVEAYEQALAKRPDFEDAAFNLELVKKLLQEQSADSSDSSQQDQNGEEEQKGDERQQSDSSEEGDQSREGQNQRSSDSQSQNETEIDQSQTESEQEQDQQNNQSESDSQNPSDNSNQSPQDTDSVQLAQQNQNSLSEEEKQALEQWLRQIPDDPGGLLRRKFHYQYQLRPQTRNSEPW